MSFQPQLSNLPNLPLIHSTVAKIIGNQLPSNLQVLQLLFHKIRNANVTVNNSINSVLEEVKIVWDRALIATRKIDRCREKLKNLYTEPFENIQLYFQLDFHLDSTWIPSGLCWIPARFDWKSGLNFQFDFQL